MLYNISVMLSPALTKQILNVHPSSDSTELAEAVLIESIDVDEGSDKNLNL